MKISGWQRVGIVLSVFWILLVASFAADEMVKGSPFNENRFVEIVSDDSVAPIRETDPDTGKPALHALQPVKPVLDLRYVLIIAVVPVLLAWLFIYLTLFVRRWVKDGFRSQ